ncbi:MAG: M23 family metallopeptidase [Candidatus Latescibacteria bacterium]|jgi:murein DD-endopeptidase MepM/ murein hydrolase activator NlpD|nr:M23 family metallopeptidase [Candidatus Latescibacterota bacterium]
MKLIAASVIVFLIIAAYPSFQYQRMLVGAPALETRVSGAQVANGETLLLEIIQADTVALGHIAVGIGDTTALRLYPHPAEEDDALFAMLGIDYYARPYEDTLRVMWTEDDIFYERAIPFAVVSGTYPSTRITGVPQSRVTPSAADYRRIARERRQIGAAYISVRDSLLMDGPFRMPTEKVTITGEYGSRRVFNGQLRSVHSGLDMRAYAGTPLYAAQSGRVKLAKNLFYSGNHVLIEHGMGIYSSYSHMSKLEVKTGEWVEEGQLMGLSGATGRVTAAHLHWTVNVNGVRVSPLQFYDVLATLYRTEDSSQHFE